MSAHKDQYDFSRPSTSGRAGFEPFTDAGSGHHFFHFNDENGQPLLFSQGYQSPEKRDNGMGSVEKNRTVPGRVAAIEAEGGFSIVVRAGNNQEIARSRPYPTEELSVSVRKAVTRPETDQKIAKTAEKPAPIAPETASATTTAALVKPDPAARHVFKISLYQTGENEAFQGKIEHMFSNEKAAFTGADLDAIGGFIKKTVPAIERPQATAARTLSVAAAEVGGAVEKLIEKPDENPTPQPTGAPVFSIANAGKNPQPQPAKRMRVLATARFEFTGADVDATAETDEEDAEPFENQPFEAAASGKSSISAAQAIVNAHLRPSSPEAQPSVSRGTSVVVAPPKAAEPMKPVPTRANLAIVSPAPDFKPVDPDLAAKRMVERIIDGSGSGKATVSNAPAIAGPIFSGPIGPRPDPPAAPKSAAPVPAIGTTTHFVGEKSQPAAQAASPENSGKTTFFIGEMTQKGTFHAPSAQPPVRRVLDPGQTQPDWAGKKAVNKTVHYVG